MTSGPVLPLQVGGFPPTPLHDRLSNVDSSLACLRDWWVREDVIFKRPLWSQSFPSRVHWHTLLIPALRQKQVDLREFKATLGLLRSKQSQTIEEPSKDRPTTCEPYLWGPHIWESRKDLRELRLQRAIRADCIQTSHPTKLSPLHLILLYSIPSVNSKVSSVLLSSYFYSLNLLSISPPPSLYSLPFYFPFDRFSQRI